MTNYAYYERNLFTQNLWLNCYVNIFYNLQKDRKASIAANAAAVDVKEVIAELPTSSFAPASASSSLLPGPSTPPASGAAASSSSGGASPASSAGASSPASAAGASLSGASSAASVTAS